MKLIDIALKDLLRSVRSLFAIGMMVVAPLLLTGLIFLAFSGMSGGTTDLPVIRVAVVNLDQPQGDLALGDLLAEMFFDDSISTWIQATDLPDEASAHAAVNRQEAGAAVIIPPNFSLAALGQDEQAEIITLQDPTLTIGPAVVKNMVSSFIDGVLGGRIALQTTGDRLALQGLALTPISQADLINAYQSWFTEFQRTLYHSPESALALKSLTKTSNPAANDPFKGIMAKIMAGQMVFFAFFTGAYSMVSILHESEQGTLPRLFTTPTNRTIILGGKFLAVFLTVIIQGLVLITIGRLVFKIEWGQPAAVLLALVGQVLGASGLGVLLISLVKSTKQEGLVMGGALTALGMIGGLFTMGVAMPKSFQTLTFFTPHGWVIQGWKLAMDSAPLSELALPFLILLAAGVIMFLAGALLFRRRFA